jgi:hypothetical protein
VAFGPPLIENPAPDGGAASAQPRAPYRPEPATFLDVGAGLTLAKATAEAATHLCLNAVGYAHEGRGPHTWDDLGLARAAVQCALDWRAASDALRDGRAPMLTDPIPDFADYAPASWRHDPTPMRNMLRDEWGLYEHAIGAGVLKEALPGDLIVYMGRGPRLGVVIAPWVEGPSFPHFNPPVVATVWEDDAPVMARQARMSWHPLALMRWLEAVR